MTCCTNDCNQGRECPARVAKAKPVMKAADPLPPSVWRCQLRKLAYWMLLAVFGMLWMGWLCLAFYALERAKTTQAQHSSEQDHERLVVDGWQRRHGDA